VESGSAQQSAFASVLEAVEFAMDAVAGSKNGITLQGVTTKLFASYSVPQYKSGQHGTTYKQPILDILHYNAAELLRHLDDSKYSESDFRNWLAQAAEKEFQPIALKSSDFPYHIFRRQSRPFQPRTLTRASNGNEDQSIMSAHTPSAPRGKGLKTPGRTPGKSSLRPITSSKKRYHEDLEDGSEADSPSLTKKSHYFNEIEEEDDDDENMEDAAPHDSLSSSDEEELIKLVIRAEKLPSSVARGPHDTWTCDQENCDYIVRGEDQKECQERIQEHFANHENHSQRVQLAMTEGSRGHLPIKYAFFPPFLITVELHPRPILHSAQSGEQDHHARVAPPGTVGGYKVVSPFVSPSLPNVPTGKDAQVSLREALNQYRRQPHAVSDVIHRLTISQPSIREDPKAGPGVTAEGPAARQRCTSARSNQTEDDSMTE
jgi:hypothetical protein